MYFVEVLSWRLASKWGVIMFDKNAMIDVPCPECGSKKKLSIGTLERNPSFVCGKCKKKVTVDASKFTKGLKEAEQKISSVFKNLKFK